MNHSLFEIHRATTPSGLRLLALPMKSTGTVTVMAFAGTGSRHENPEEAGVSHFLEHLFFKGSKKRPTTLIISEVLDEVGGEFNAFTSKEMTAFYAKAASKHTKLLLDVLGDMLINPLFKQKEIDRERGVVIEEMNMYEDSPQDSIGEQFEQQLFGEHDLARKIIGTKDIISTITKKRIVKYRNQQYGAPNMVVCIAGNIDPKKGLAMLKRQFSGLPKQAPVKTREFNGVWGADLVSLRIKKTDQAHVIIGGRGTSLLDADRCAVDLLSTILGGSMSSRLFIEVRERRGLAYSVHTSAEHFVDTGHIATQIGVDPGNVGKALSVILKEYKKVREVLVSDTELKKAKENIKGHLLIRLESTNAVAQFIGGQVTLTGRILTLEEIFKAFDVVTSADIQRVAQKYLAPEYLRIAAIMPNDVKNELTQLLIKEV